MTYSTTKRISKKELVSLFQSVDWGSGNYPEKLHRAVKSSDRVISCWEYGKLVGLMTAISDKGMNVYFPYLLVRPEYQKSGIGITICSKMLDYYNKYYRKMLFCDDSKVDFYKKSGFYKEDGANALIIITE